MAVCKSIGIRSRREVQTVSFRPSIPIRHSRLVNVSPPLDNKMNYTKKEWDIASELLHSRQSEHERKDERNMKQLKKGKFFLRIPRCTFQFPLFVWKNIFFQFCVIDAVYGLLLHIKCRWILWIPYQKQKGKKKWIKNYILIRKQRNKGNINWQSNYDSSGPRHSAIYFHFHLLTARYFDKTQGRYWC